MTNRNYKSFFTQLKLWNNLEKTISLRNCHNSNLKQPPGVFAFSKNNDELKSYIRTWDEVIIPDIKEIIRKHDTKDLILEKRIIKLLDYTIRSSQNKNNYGYAAIKLFKSLSPNNEHNLMLSHILSWCMEMTMEGLLIQDDIIDKGDMRWGLPTWHNLDGIGLTAINDSMIISQLPWIILNKYFKEDYNKIISIFNEMKLVTCFGQSIDMSIDKQNVLNFSMEKYKTLVKAKNGFIKYAVELVIVLVPESKVDTEKFCEIFTELSEFMQVHNDFNDVFGYKDTGIDIGRVGNDIANNKCTWLIVTALEKATLEQKEILKNSYGSKDPQKIMQVKQVYEDLNLPRIYNLWKKETTERIIKKALMLYPSPLCRLIIEIFGDIQKIFG